MSQTGHLKCEDVFQHLNDFIDRELSLDDMEKVSVHLEQCIQCAEQVACEASALRQIRIALQRIRLPRDVKLAITTALDKECGSQE